MKHLFSKKRACSAASVLSACAVLLSLCAGCAPAESGGGGGGSGPPPAKEEPVVYETLRPGQEWLDTNGVPIQAHSGQVQLLTYADRSGETVTRYWWVGEDKTGMTNYHDKTNGGIHAYSSDDLMNWTDEGVVLRSPAVKSETENEYFREVYAPDPAYPESTAELAWECLHQDGGVVERPKMLYNAKNDNYVIWFHQDEYDYRVPSLNVATAGVAVAEHPWGPFRLINRYRLYCDKANTQFGEAEYGSARDMTLFEDGGKAYIVYSSDWNRSLYIGLLNEDYTAPAVDPDSAVEGMHYVRIRFEEVGNREAPAMCKIAGRYYLMTSGCAAWQSTQAQIYSAPAVFGPWTVDGDPCVDDPAHETYQSQSTCIFWSGSEWIYMGDRWGWAPGDTYFDIQTSRYVWLPVKLSDGKITIEWRDEWTPAGHAQ